MRVVYSILDNLGSHKRRTVGQAIHGAGAKLWFLPPYSPDLNPIAQAFTMIKHWMRESQKCTPEDASQYLGELIGTIGPNECQN